VWECSRWVGGRVLGGHAHQARILLALLLASVVSRADAYMYMPFTKLIHSAWTLASLINTQAPQQGLLCRMHWPELHLCT
jgi:hypothetical protein